MFAGVRCLAVQFEQWLKREIRRDFWLTATVT